MRVLIVEDDAFISELLCDGLADDGYECDVAATAAQGEELARLFPYGVLILDVMLPGEADAGFRLGQRLRGLGLTTPMLYLTARGLPEDRIRGLDAGGDDYLTKPFDFGELRARIRALLRRAGGHPQNTVPLPGEWMLDLGGREVCRGGARADLTRREFLLLELLVLHPGRVFGRDEIIERLWGGENGVEPKVIDVYVSTLRRKTNEALIETVRGSGYRIGRVAG
ncbi:response regulator transcription factor (plasmid) [Deinococcus sp. KNUC1210]|uniref:response regulator transcription factor n=1 Tax=Deinococcus sp. KNUC1210 TaxID=2917691 RepID=UPI001EEF92A5|nr:response regulator transcription factor [Deinococcus sp. KNUC1210]ULH17128.1 response regulator transcription factor [Deinococcus sp. KNUC1210]